MQGSSRRRGCVSVVLSFLFSYPQPHILLIQLGTLLRSKRKLEETTSDDEPETQGEGHSTRSPSPDETQSRSMKRTQSKSQNQTNTTGGSSSSQRALKRTKTGGSGSFENEQPTNTVLPTTIEFPTKTEGCLKISAWNILSLASSQKKVTFRIRIVHSGSNER